LLHLKPDQLPAPPELHHTPRHLQQEIDELCREWKPEPLVPDVTEEDRLPDPPVIEEWESSHWVTVAGRRALNLAAADFLGLGNDPAVQVAPPRSARGVRVRVRRRLMAVVRAVVGWALLRLGAVAAAAAVRIDAESAERSGTAAAAETLMCARFVPPLLE
jgi:hypothetical protein